VTAAGQSEPVPLITADQAAELACRFHTAYERLAPHYGYRTREASAVPWHRVPGTNRALMIDVAANVCGPMVAALERLLAVAEGAISRTHHQSSADFVAALQDARDVISGLGP
jgi:hypothetical protein